MQLLSEFDDSIVKSKFIFAVSVLMQTFGLDTLHIL